MLYQMGPITLGKLLEYGESIQGEQRYCMENQINTKHQKLFTRSKSTTQSCLPGTNLLVTRFVHSS